MSKTIENLIDEGKFGHSVDSFVREFESRDFVATITPRIKEKHRQIIDLRFNEELTFAEIAKKLNVTSSAVGAKIRRALMHLRKIVNSLDKTREVDLLDINFSSSN